MQETSFQSYDRIKIRKQLIAIKSQANLDEDLIAL